MGSQSRPHAAALTADLKNNAHTFDFFKAVRVAEKVVGSEENLRFRPYAGCGRPPSDIRSIGEEENRLVFTLNFLGLYGINSPLPRCYHDHLASEEMEAGTGNVPLKNFLDIFNNRFYWLYYCAWKKYRRHLLAPLEAGKGNTVWSRFTGDANLDAGIPPSLNVPALLRVSSVLCTRTRNSSGLRILLQEFFPDIPIHVSQFIPEKTVLGEPLRMGKNVAARMNRKGFMGRTFVDRRNRIRVDVGPVTFAQGQEVAPWGRSATLLRQLIDYYVRVGIKTDVRIIIRSSTIPEVRMGDTVAMLGRGFSMGTPKCEFDIVDYPHERYRIAEV